MDWMGVLATVMRWIQVAISYILGLLYHVAEVLWQGIQDIAKVFPAIWDGIKWFGTHLWRGLKALRHLNFSSIWSAIKRAYNRFLKAFDWWRRHVLGPLERMRRQIWQIYRTFFKPIILFIDSLRVFVRMVAIFDRKLAARLDHYLMSLEGKLLAPITATLRRLNAISSYFTALITTAGGLARPLLLESMRRDALLVWEVLTNPRAMIYSPPPAIQGRGIAGASRDFREYLEHATGPLAMTEAADRAALLAGFEEAQ